MHPRCRVIRPLSEEQVATLLDGKPVLGSLREIQEARNAIKAYDRYESWAPGSERDLLCAHDVLMAGLLDHPGRYRRGGVAVGGAGVVHHVAPPAGRVPELMAALLHWVVSTGDHPLIVSSVFHYELEAGRRRCRHPLARPGRGSECRGFAGRASIGREPAIFHALVADP